MLLLQILLFPFQQGAEVLHKSLHQFLPSEEHSLLHCLPLNILRAPFDMVTTSPFLGTSVLWEGVYNMCAFISFCFFYYLLRACTPLIPLSAFKALCKFILKKQFILNFEVLCKNLVISNSFASISTQSNYQVWQTTWKFMVNCFLSMNL